MLGATVWISVRTTVVGTSLVVVIEEVIKIVETMVVAGKVTVDTTVDPGRVTVLTTVDAEIVIVDSWIDVTVLAGS